MRIVSWTGQEITSVPIINLNDFLNAQFVGASVQTIHRITDLQIIELFPLLISNHVTLLSKVSKSVLVHFENQFQFRQILY